MPTHVTPKRAARPRIRATSAVSKPGSKPASKPASRPAAKPRALPDRDPAGGLAGTQTAVRAIRLLRIIAAHNPVGITLSDLATEAGLTRPTAYRLASCLIAERMAIRHASTRKFDLGPRAFQLGPTTYAFSDVLRICSPSVNRIAAQTQDHVCLIIRTGFDIVPICEVPAVVPIRPMIRTYAEPAPLGSTPAGIALLAGFPDSQVRAIVKQNEKDPLRRWRTVPKAILPAVQAARSNGYSVAVNYLARGVGGVAVAIPAGGSIPYLALSNLSVNDRIVGARQTFLAELLMREAEQLSKALSENGLVD